MLDQKVVLRKKRDFSDVLNASFAFIRQDLKPLLRLLLIYAGVPVLAQAILSGIFMDSTFSNFFENLGNPTATQQLVSQMPGKALLINLISLIVQVFLTGLTYCYIVLYAEKGAGGFQLDEVWNKFTSFFLAFLGFNILTGIVIVLAFMALIIPGFYVLAPLSMILIVKVSENEGYGDSFSRCFYLVKDHWWETFGLFIVSTIIYLILGGLFGIPAMVLGSMQALLQGGADFSSSAYIITSVISTLGVALLTPLVPVVMAFQYYSLVEHKDNLSLLDKIDRINQEPKSDNE